MPLPAEQGCEQEKLRLLLLALGLATLEFFIPRLPVFPWLKPGIANAVTLVWLLRYGFRDALLFVMLRSWISSFYFGFSFITTVLGLSGAVCALCAAQIFRLCSPGGSLFGLAGLSMVAAFAHNAGQLGAVYLFLIRSPRLIGQLPVMAGASVVFGLITAIFAAVIQRLPAVDTLDSLAQNHLDSSMVPKMPGRTKRLLCLGLLAVCLGVTFVDSFVVLAAIALAVTAAVQIAAGWSLQALVRPVRRFWLLFVMVALLQGWYSSGIPIHPKLPWLFKEGVYDSLRAWLRLFMWLQSSALFLNLGFNAILHSLLKKMFPSRSDTLYAAVKGLELFPEVVERVRAHGGGLLKTLFLKPALFIPRLTAIILARESYVTPPKYPKGTRPPEGDFKPLSYTENDSVDV